MNNERLMAGAFAGIGGLVSLVLGVWKNDATLTTAGLLLLSNMMAFFVGEKNGAKAASKDSTEA